MFRKRCHKPGRAIVRAGELLVLCECLTNDDIETVLDWNNEDV